MTDTEDDEYIRTFRDAVVVELQCRFCGTTTNKKGTPFSDTAALAQHEVVWCEKNPDATRPHYHNSVSARSYCPRCLAAMQAQAETPST